MPAPTESILIPLTIHFQEPQTGPVGPTDQQGGGAGGAGTQQPAGTGGATGGAPAQEQCGTSTFVMMGLFLALMYFMVLRPESKRRKETQSMLSLLKVGDHVVTIGGMHGTVAKLTEKDVTVRVDDLQMLFDRSAIARVVRDEAAEITKS